MKKSNLNEIKRMQQLAGINEIKINNPSDIVNYIDSILPDYEVTDMKSLEHEMEYSDLIDAVAEKIKGSAMGSISTEEQVPFFLRAKQALLQYGKEKFGSMDNEIKLDGNFTYMDANIRILHKYINKNFPELNVSINQCRDLIDYVEENTAQDAEDAGEEMELTKIPVDEFWEMYSDSLED